MVSQNLENALKVLEKAPKSTKKINLGSAYFEKHGRSIHMCACGFLAKKAGAKPTFWNPDTLRTQEVLVGDSRKFTLDAVKSLYGLTTEEAEKIVDANWYATTYKGVAKLVRNPLFRDGFVDNVPIQHNDGSFRSLHNGNIYITNKQ